MNSAELVKEGRLTEARAQLIDEVKASPGNSDFRLLLFKVLVFLGEWDKALLQLDILAVNTPGMVVEINQYRNLIAAEKSRNEVCLNKKIPDFMTDPPDFLPDFISARDDLVKGNGSGFSSLLSRIEEIQGSLAGTLNGNRFEGFTDLDATLFPFLEVFIHDRYLWFPITSIRELAVQAPTSVLDLLWIPARIVTWDGLTTDCILPVLYPGAGAQRDDSVRFGRLTEWVELASGYSRGVGQHLFLVGEEEKGLLELQELTFDAPQQENN